MQSSALSKDSPLTINTCPLSKTTAQCHRFAGARLRFISSRARAVPLYVNGTIRAVELGLNVKLPGQKLT